MLTTEDIKHVASYIDLNPHARSFLSWAAKYFVEVASSGAVSRKIAHTYLYHKDKGSLLNTTWENYAPAHGKRYT